MPKAKSDVDIRKFLPKVIQKTTTPPPLTAAQMDALKNQRLAAMTKAQAQKQVTNLSVNNDAAKMMPAWMEQTNRNASTIQQQVDQQRKFTAQKKTVTNPLTPHWAAPTPFVTHNPLWKPANPFEPNRRNPLSPDWILPTPVPPRKEASSQGAERNDPQDRFAMTERANNRRAWEEQMAAKNYFNSLPPLVKGAPKTTPIIQESAWQGYGYPDTGGYYNGGGGGGGGYSGYASWISNLTSWNIG